MSKTINIGPKLVFKKTKNVYRQDIQQKEKYINSDKYINWERSVFKSWEEHLNYLSKIKNANNST